MKKNLYIISIISSLLLSQNLSAEEKIYLSLNPLVKEVLNRNGESVKEYFQTNISQTQISYEKGIYDPIFSTTVSRQSTNVPNSAEDKVIRYDADTYQDKIDFLDTGFSGLLPTGTQWSLFFSNNKKQSSLIRQTENYDFEYDSSLKLQIEQPLLKNAGIEMTEAKIKLSEFEDEIEKYKYEQKLMELQGITIQLYWKLYGSYAIYKSWEQSIKLAEKAFEELEIRAKSGKIPQTEILEATSALNIRKSEYENAKNRFVELQNQILTVLNVSVNENEKFEFVLSEKPEDRISEVLSLSNYASQAFEKWPEYLISKKNLEKEELQLKYAKNQLLPKLNLVASTQRNALTSDRHDSYDGAFDDEFVSWALGLKFEKPLFDEKEKSSVKIALLKVNQAKIDLRSLENNLKNSLMTKIENLQGSKKQYLLYKEGLKIKKDLIDIDYERLSLGKITAKELFEKEEDYMNYQRKMLSSIINWKTAEAMLDISTGNLLNRYNIDVKSLQHSFEDNDVNIKELFKKGTL